MPSLPARLGLCVLSFVVFALVSGGVRSLRGATDRDQVAEKLAYLGEHAPGRTAILFGNSTALHGMDPRIFNPRVQASVPEFDCINGAVAGMGSFEMDLFIRDVLSLPGVEPRWVLIPTGSWLPWMHERYVGTDRTQEWHEPKTTLAVTRAALEMPPSIRWRWVAYHLADGCHRFGNYGQTRRLADGLTEKSPKLFYAEGLLEQGEGYASIEDVRGMQHLRNNPALLENLDRYTRKVAQISSDHRIPFEGRRRAEHLRQQRWLEDQGIEVIYYVPPYQNKLAWIEDMQAQGAAPVLLNFMDPVRFPEFYVLENRFDEFHVNVHGARLLSATLGEGLRRVLSGMAIQ